uniref:Uncharacterized protein n=1 Tax=Cacopsylla melanoneura TaxID=428564 RepID=A0A8D8LRY8_9HEMI
MALSKLDIIKLWIFTSLSMTLTMAQNEEQRQAYYMKKWNNIKWHSTKPDDYYDVLQTDPPTPPPEAHVPIYFDNCTDKYIGEIIFKEFLPMKFTIKRNHRLQKVLRTNFEDAEAFSLFIVSEKFIGVDDWKVVSIKRVGMYKATRR